jgi:glycosyltransferase involved in cell wall biosynthesis
VHSSDGRYGTEVQVSVIVTVKNESATIGRLLKSLCRQTRPPDEVVIVDGGSGDDTVAQLEAWASRRRVPLRILVESGANISRGRNVAIAAARGPIIASTDAGVRLASDWLEELLRPFAGGRGTPDSIVACGFYQPDTSSVFEIAMGATVLPVLADVRPEKFLPSSRSIAFPKSAWSATGGYPEWLDYCEDLVFDFRLRARGYHFVFVPKAVVHFKPRSDLQSFFQQYYRYARGDGKADLWRSRHALRYATYLGLLPGELWLAFNRSILGALALVSLTIAVLWTPYKRLFAATHTLEFSERVRAGLLVPVIRVTGDVAKMLGYPAGLFWRWRHRRSIPAWRN